MKIPFRRPLHGDSLFPEDRKLRSPGQECHICSGQRQKSSDTATCRS